MYVLECYDIGVPGGCEPPKGAKESTLRLPWLVKRGTVEVSLGYRRSVNIVSLYSHDAFQCTDSSAQSFCSYRPRL